MRDVLLAAGVPSHHPAPSKSALPHHAPSHPDSAELAAPSVGSFSSVDLLRSTQEEGLPGLYRLLHNAQDRDPQLLTQAMQELLTALDNYMLTPRHLGDAGRLKKHLLNSGLFLDAQLAAGQPSPGLQEDLKARLNKALQQFLPNQILTDKSGGTAFEHLPELTARILHKNQYEMQKQIIGKLLQTGPMLDEYQQNTVTPGKTPTANRHLSTWLGHAVEESLCQIVQQQLHSFSDENQQYWRLSLYAEQGGELLKVPVEIQHSTAEPTEPWLLGFTVKLPSGNTVKVSMEVDKGNASVQLEADDILTNHRLARRQDRLRLVFKSHGMKLQDLLTTSPGKGHA